LNRELGVKRLILEGDGVSNGAFPVGGLVDEISLIVCPAIDGAKGAPSIFDSAKEVFGGSTPVRSMTPRVISFSRAATRQKAGRILAAGLYRDFCLQR